MSNDTSLKACAMARRKRQLSPGELISDKRPRTDVNEDQDEGKLLYAVATVYCQSLILIICIQSYRGHHPQAKVPQMNDL
jgi:hypothetical protein